MKGARFTIRRAARRLTSSLLHNATDDEKTRRLEFITADVHRRSIVVWIARQQRTEIPLTGMARPLACINPLRNG
jgi:hypothetical protein